MAPNASKPRQCKQYFDDPLTFIKTYRRRSKVRISLNNFAKGCLITAVFALLCVPINARSDMDLGRCCMKAAREQFNETNLLKPWNVCGVSPVFDFSNPGSPNPSVNVSLGWCKAHCPGYQKSSAQQWLQPLSTWGIQAITLLVLCTVGETGSTKRKWPFFILYYKIKEYVAILGDPASAICGAFSELWMDALMAQKLTKQKPGQVELQIAILASQTRFPPAEEQVRYQALRCDARAMFENTERVFRTILEARADFVNGVMVPLVLLLVTTYSTFNDAKNQLGSNDSAHNLAYGIWYSWLIILAVVSNSYIASTNPGLTQDIIRDLVNLRPGTVPLRMRVATVYDWKRWANTTSNGSFSFTRQSRPAFFYLGYIGGQTAAWICVAFTCSCAAAISYNTPTVGIGCRSFGFLLYGVLAFILAWLMVLRTWVELRDALSNDALSNDQRKKSYVSWIAKLLKYLYVLIVSSNAFVLIFSTIAQLVGLYRSCFCDHFGSLSDLVELSTGTELSLNNGAVTWLPVGFVAYTVVWIVCVISVGFRTFNNACIQKFLSHERPDEPSDGQEIK